MFVYIIVILMCFVSMVFSNRNQILITEAQRNSERKKLYIAIIIYMILLCGFRSYDRIYHVGMDTYTYATMYKQRASETFTEIISLESTDKGYVYLVWFLGRVLHMNFTVAMMLFASVYIIAMAVFIYKYSKNIFVSLLVFVGMGLYIFAFSAIRQSLAMGICLTAYMYCDTHKGIKSFFIYTIMIWLAYTIHASAVVFFPVYFLCRLKMNTKYIFIMLGIAAIILIFKNAATSIMFQWAGNISTKYENASNLIEEQNAGMRLYVFIIFIILLRIIFKGRIKNNEKNDNLIYMMLCMLIAFPMTQGGGALMRIYFYYYMFIVVYLPNIVEDIKLKNDRMLTYFGLICFLLWYFFSSVLQGMTIVPYSFFWRR